MTCRVSRRREVLGEIVLEKNWILVDLGVYGHFTWCAYRNATCDCILFDWNKREQIIKCYHSHEPHWDFKKLLD
jgi:hypothetical protein